MTLAGDVALLLGTTGLKKLDMPRTGALFPTVAGNPRPDKGFTTRGAPWLSDMPVLVTTRPPVNGSSGKALRLSTVPLLPRKRKLLRVPLLRELTTALL